MAQKQSARRGLRIATSRIAWGDRTPLNAACSPLMDEPTMRSFPQAVLALIPLVVASSLVRAAEPVDFPRQVQPILERACIQCHGPEKQKGKLRLDSGEALQKGGENGPPITPGKPDESDFYRRVTLE